MLDEFIAKRTFEITYEGKKVEIVKGKIYMEYPPITNNNVIGLIETDTDQKFFWKRRTFTEYFKKVH